MAVSVSTKTPKHNSFTRTRNAITIIAMSSGYEVVDEVCFGEQEGVPSEWKTARAMFPDFAALSSGRGDRTDSPVLKCHGLEWRIWLYPGGDRYSSKEDVFISMYLHSESCSNAKKVRAKFRIRIPSGGRTVGGEAFRIFSPKLTANEGPGWGSKECAKREDFLKPSNNYLVDGNLTVEVDIQVLLDKPPVWTPTNTLSPDMLAFLDAADNAADADNTIPAVVTFDVASCDGKETLYAHGQILAARCPALASLAEGCGPNNPIPIEDVRADVFRMLLRYVYGGEIPSKDVITEQAKPIIHAADKYGCTGLKLAAEAEMAAASITIENTAELILFADATNCALLKETAMDFFVKNSDEVIASEGYEQVKESPALLAELVAAMAPGSKKRPAAATDANDSDYKRMRVIPLRQKLNEKGFDVDGSRETLIARLVAVAETATH